LEVVDAVGARDHALEGGRDEAAHEIGVRTDVGRRHRHDRDVALRVLPDAERTNRLEPGDEDDEARHHRQYGPLDEQIGEVHQLSSGFGVGSFAGRIELFTRTAAPFRSLNTPDVTTTSPGFNPERTDTWSPRPAPSFTKRCWTPTYGLPPGPLS